MKIVRFLTATLFLATASASSSWSSPIAETLLLKQVPSDQQLRDWSKLPIPPGYRLDLGDAYPNELETLRKIDRFRFLQIELRDFPNESNEPILTELAAKGAELILLGTTYPTSFDIARLNRIHPRKLLLVMTGYPDPADGRALATLRSPLQLVLAVKAYPRFVDRPSLESIPSSIALNFSTDYWPWYSHMDIFNVIPHSLRLRVSGSFPPAESLPYLRNIKRLESISVEQFGPLAGNPWSVFGEIPVRWLSTQYVPSSTELEAFAASASQPDLRSLVIDADGELTSAQRSALEKSPLAIEWIHAPFDRRSARE